MRALGKLLPAIFLLLTCFPVCAQTSITVANHSFETYNTLTTSNGNGQYNSGPVPSWTTTGANGTAGSWIPSASEFTTVPDGSVIVWVGYNGSGATSLTQDIGSDALQNVVYTLTAYVGNRGDGNDSSATWVIALYAGSTQLCSNSGAISSIPSKGWTKETLTCTTNSSPVGDLIVSLSVSGAGGASYDNVALTASTTPTFANGMNVGGAIVNTNAAPWIWNGPAGSCGTPPLVTSTSGSSLCIGDSNGAPNGSVNGDAWLPLTRTVGKGTATFATTAIGAGTCSAVVSPALTAIASTDSIKWSYQTQPTAGTDAALDMQYWPTAGTGLNFKRCNNTGASITPTAIVINWEITR